MGGEPRPCALDLGFSEGSRSPPPRGGGVGSRFCKNGGGRFSPPNELANLPARDYIKCQSSPARARGVTGEVGGGRLGGPGTGWAGVCLAQLHPHPQPCPPLPPPRPGSPAAAPTTGRGGGGEWGGVTQPGFFFFLCPLPPPGRGRGLGGARAGSTGESRPDPAGLLPAPRPPGGRPVGALRSPWGQHLKEGYPQASVPPFFIPWPGIGRRRVGRVARSPWPLVNFKPMSLVSMCLPVVVNGEPLAQPPPHSCDLKASSGVAPWPNGTQYIYLFIYLTLNGGNPACPPTYAAEGKLVTPE